MMNLVFATQNRSKLVEITHLLQNSYSLKRRGTGSLKTENLPLAESKPSDYYRLMDLSDLGCTEELPETHDTLEENAMEKAFYVYKKYHINCFADDSALEVDALGGRPGVYSARYAGEEKSAEANMNKLLNEMKDFSNRQAQFRTVIALVIEGESFLFDGIIKGMILHEKKGSSGFGYDPVFQPENHTLSFAEMSPEEKNKISHRSIAVQKLIQFLIKRP
jgi:XTP/dITP diphosphohydrolase